MGVEKRIAAVWVGADPTTATLAGSAIPIVRDPGGDVLLLTCLHVVWPRGPAPAPQVWVSLPLVDATPAGRVAATLAPPAWSGPPAGTDTGQVTDVPAAEDWAVLRATLPAAEVPEWGPLDLDAPGDGSIEGERVGWSGRGFPSVMAGKMAALEGAVIGRQPLGGTVCAQLRIDRGGDGLDPRGISGGPVFVGGRVVGMFVAAVRLASAAAGNIAMGGTLYAHPLATVLRAARDHLPGLASARAVALARARPEGKERLDAAEALYGGLSAPDRDAFDDSASDAWRESQGEEIEAPVGPGAFLQAVARLADLGGAGNPEKLAALYAAMGARLGRLADRLPRLSVGPAGAPPPADVLAVEILPRADGAAAHALVLWERKAGRWKAVARGEAPAGPSLAEAVVNFVGGRVNKLPTTVRLQVWAPPELIGLPFDEVRVPWVFGPRPLGKAHALELRVRWDPGIVDQTSAEVPPEVRLARATALRDLTAPLPAVPRMAKPPPNDVRALFLAEGAAPGDWFDFAKVNKALLVVACDRPLSSDIAADPLAELHLAGVPVLAWARSADSRLDEVLTSDPNHGGLAAGDLPSRVARAAQSEPLPKVSLVVEPPDDPLPDPALLDDPGGSA